MPTVTLPWVVPTNIGSLVVTGLQSQSQHISSFVVEVYSDSALTQLVTKKTIASFWDGTNNSQVGATIISGLPTGVSYWLRVGTCSEHSEIASWNDPYQVNLAAPEDLSTITYGGTFTATSSGVSYLVRPNSPFSDIDHYEAAYTINSSTVPDPSAKPSWIGHPDASGLLTFGAVGAPGQVIRAYVRAVNMAVNYQAWTLISTLTVTPNGSVGSLDSVPDGATYARTKASGLTAGVPDPRKSSGLLKLGSINPAWSGSLYWAASTTGTLAGQVQFWWDQLVVKRADGTQTVVGGRPSSSPVNVNALQSSTSGTTVVYDFYPYIDDFANVVSFLAGPSGVPAYGWLDSTLTSDQATTNSQQMNRQDRLGMGPIQISMPVWTGSSGGTAGGGGGYGGTCPRGDMKVRLLNGEVIRADEIKVGDKLLTTLEYGLTTRVLSVRHQVHSEWIEIQTTKGSVIVHPSTHVPVEEQADCVPAKDLALSHILKSRKGSARITGIRLVQEEHTRVILTCDKDKVFLCGQDSPDLVIHNVRLPNC